MKNQACLQRHTQQQDYCRTVIIIIIIIIIIMSFIKTMTNRIVTIGKMMNDQ